MTDEHRGDAERAPRPSRRPRTDAARRGPGGAPRRDRPKAPPGRQPPGGARSHGTAGARRSASPSPPSVHRRRTPAAPPIASFGEDAAIELDVRVRPGEEELAAKELGAFGATVEVRGRGELRVLPGGPLRPLLLQERPLAIYVVRALPGLILRDLGGDEARNAALELAAIVANVGFKGKLRTYRVTGAPELVGDRKILGRLSGRVGRRLGLEESPLSPDLILIVRTRPGGLELAARLPRLV